MIFIDFNCLKQNPQLSILYSLLVLLVSAGAVSSSTSDNTDWMWIASSYLNVEFQLFVLWFQLFVLWMNWTIHLIHIILIAWINSWIFFSWVSQIWFNCQQLMHWKEEEKARADAALQAHPRTFAVDLNWHLSDENINNKPAGEAALNKGGQPKILIEVPLPFWR